MRNSIPLFASLLAACGSTTTAETTVSCSETITTVNAAGSFALHECFDYANTTPSVQNDLAHSCGSWTSDAGTAIVGAFAASPCDHTGSPGGCRTATSAGTITVWFYNEPDAGPI